MPGYLLRLRLPRAGEREGGGEASLRPGALGKPRPLHLEQFSSYILAEMLGYAVSFSSPWRGKQRVFEWRNPAFMDQLQPSTNADKLSDHGYRYLGEREEPGSDCSIPYQFHLSSLLLYILLVLDESELCPSNVLKIKISLLRFSDVVSSYFLPMFQAG